MTVRGMTGLADALDHRERVDYDHALNRHTLTSPRVVIPLLFEKSVPRSVLDVGCGTGTWLAAAREYGVDDVFGVDGVRGANAEGLIPLERFRVVDLTAPWALGRTFDIAFCLEVGEHLPPVAARSLVEALTRHARQVVFSAGCPGQPGQHHVNCQWPEYWQSLFNDQGFTCSDAIRWRIWNEPAVEPWYRQNMFEATADPERAGSEPRLKAVIHPDLLEHLAYPRARAAADQREEDLRAGAKPLRWYAALAIEALAAKARRLVGAA